MDQSFSQASLTHLPPQNLDELGVPLQVFTKSSREKRPIRPRRIRHWNPSKREENTSGPWAKEVCVAKMEAGGSDRA